MLEEIAAAVLYEGYILWPYRRSARKNQQRWTFGGVYPRGYVEAARSGRMMRRTSTKVMPPDSSRDRDVADREGASLLDDSVHRGSAGKTHDKDEHEKKGDTAPTR